MFNFFIILLFIAGLTGGGIFIREYQLPKLETGARIFSLFIASLLLFINQKFYNTVNFKISNQVSDEYITGIVLESISIDGEDLEITNKLNQFGYTSTKFKVPSNGYYDYYMVFTIKIDIDGDGQVERVEGESRELIYIESGDVFDIQENLDFFQPELKLVKRQ